MKQSVLSFSLILFSVFFLQTRTCASLPDLVITSVTPNQNLVPGQTTTFSVRVKNVGTASTGNFWLGVLVFMNGNYADWGGFNVSLNPGEEVVIPTVASATVQSVPVVLRAEADFPNFLTEQDESNNVFTADTRPGKDLVVTDVNVTQMDVLVGEKINFDVTMQNVGNERINSTWTGVLINVNGVYATWGGFSITLNPGESVTMRSEPWTASSASFSLQAFADFSNSVDESNESNNSLSKSFASSEPVYQASLASGGWSLRWSDEFNGWGAPDSTKWEYEIGFQRNAEAQYFTNRIENVRQEGGSLVIEARRENLPIAGLPNSYGATMAEYTSASLVTLGRASWTYGRFDIRAKLPTARGIWAALWTLGTNYQSVGWPRCGEIDIMEHVGWVPQTTYHSIHTNARSHWTKNEYSVPAYTPRLASDFVLYSVEWSPDKIEFFVDGRLRARYVNDGTGENSWPFFRDQYLLLSLSVGGSWGGVLGIDGDAFPQKMLIDYVRVYQR